MASINSWLLSAGLVTFLVGQHCCAHMLFNRLIADERQLCPNVDCSTKPSCSSNGQCASQQCCIDIARSKACCYSAGQPINPPITTIAPTASPTPTTTTSLTATSGQGSSPAAPSTTIAAASGPPPFCGALTQAQACVDAADKCACTNNSDCFADEICCLALTTASTYFAGCYMKIPVTTTTTTTATTAPNPQKPCPIPDPVCITGLATVSDTDNSTCSSTVACRNGELCCTVYRGAQPCCVKLPA